MSNYDPAIISTIEIFLISDQPTTCPKCSARTELILNLSSTDLEVNFCLSPVCRFIFLTAEN